MSSKLIQLLNCLKKYFTLYKGGTCIHCRKCCRVGDWILAPDGHDAYNYMLRELNNPQSGRKHLDEKKHNRWLNKFQPAETLLVDIESELKSHIPNTLSIVQRYAKRIEFVLFDTKV